MSSKRKFKKSLDNILCCGILSPVREMDCECDICEDSVFINPEKITKFDRSKYQLESFLLYCICAAGKTADIQAKKLNNFLTGINKPFNYIRNLINGEHAWPKDWPDAPTSLLQYQLKYNKLGQYKRIEKSFKNVLDFDLNCVSIADLVQVEGIGPKSARFFVMHSRRNQRIATLDVHILKWLRSMGINAPRQTPQNELSYKKLENRFLELADERGKTPAELDLEIWKKNQKKVLTKAGG